LVLYNSCHTEKKSWIGGRVGEASDYGGGRRRRTKKKKESKARAPSGMLKHGIL
jgi:hypothetical protein